MPWELFATSESTDPVWLASGCPIWGHSSVPLTASSGVRLSGPDLVTRSSCAPWRWPTHVQWWRIAPVVYGTSGPRNIPSQSDWLAAEGIWAGLPHLNACTCPTSYGKPAKYWGPLNAAHCSPQWVGGGWMTPRIEGVLVDPSWDPPGQECRLRWGCPEDLKIETGQSISCNILNTWDMLSREGNILF